MIQKLAILAFLMFVFSFAPAVSAAQLSLQTEKPKLKLGQTATVAIVLSGGEDTLGTDLVLRYDPRMLTAQKVTNSSLYPTYNPSLERRIDPAQGIITLSGSGGTGQPVAAQGEFATVVFEPIKTGKTAVYIDYEPGATNKSGILDPLGNDLMSYAPAPEPVSFVIADQNPIEKLLGWFWRIIGQNKIR